jgi:hypothetical protein
VQDHLQLSRFSRQPVTSLSSSCCLTIHTSAVLSRAASNLRLLRPRMERMEAAAGLQQMEPEEDDSVQLLRADGDAAPSLEENEDPVGGAVLPVLLATAIAVLGPFMFGFSLGCVASTHTTALVAVSLKPTWESQQYTASLPTHA